MVDSYGVVVAEILAVMLKLVMVNEERKERKKGKRE